MLAKAPYKIVLCAIGRIFFSPGEASMPAIILADTLLEELQDSQSEWCCGGTMGGMQALYNPLKG